MGEYWGLLLHLLLASSCTQFFPGSSAQNLQLDYFDEFTTEHGDGDDNNTDWSYHDDTTETPEVPINLDEVVPKGTPSPKELVSKVRGAKNPQERLKAYEDAVKVINGVQNPDPVRLQLLADIYKLPELKSLQTKISSKTLQKIFTPEPDTLSNSKHGRNLTIQDGVVVTEDEGNSYPVWKFQQVGDSEYFLIVNSRSAEAVGLEPESGAHYNALGHRVGIASLASAASNERYHWKIAYITEPDAVIFFSRRYDLTLDANEWGAVYPHVSNGNKYQRWRLL